MEWKQVTYGKNNVSIPAERWGHRMICTKSNELVMFGGFGGSPLEGRYLGDVWSFSIGSCTWQQFMTTGQVPLSRSNYSLHYDDINNRIILFGGSSDQASRSNSISVLNWTRKEWAQLEPAPNSQLPEERTYHSSQYRHPYLIIYGGEGTFGEDLDDMWVYDTLRNLWRRVVFKESQLTPKKRRFHSTALLNNYLYVVGGCNESYVLLSDMYRVDLSSLFEKNQLQGFEWECVVSGHQILGRWGHSCLISDQKIYIVGGKIGANKELDSGACFDATTQQLTILPIHQTTSFPCRRRQASVMVGTSLLIFGGFNGKYLNDFYYLTLSDDFSTNFECVVASDRNQLMEELQKQEQSGKGDITIKVARQGKVEFLLKSQRKRLQNYELFANLMKYSHQDGILLDLPSFSDITIFRLVHLCLMTKKILVCPKFSSQYWINIALTYEYLVCREELQAFGKQLCRVVNQDNCLEMLKVSSDLGMENLKRTAAEVYYLHHECPLKKHRYSESTVDSNFQVPISTHEELARPEKESPAHLVILEEVYENIWFDIEQKRLKGRSGFLSKFKSAFRRQSPEATSINENRAEIEAEGESPGCFRRFINFMAGICESSENRQAEQRT